MNRNKETKEWEREAERLSREMKSHLNALAKKGCSICNTNGDVCHHMEDKTHRKFEKRIEESLCRAWSILQDKRQMVDNISNKIALFAS